MKFNTAAMGNSRYRPIAWSRPKALAFNFTGSRTEALAFTFTRSRPEAIAFTFTIRYYRPTLKMSHPKHSSIVIHTRTVISPETFSLGFINFVLFVNSVFQYIFDVFIYSGRIKIFSLISKHALTFFLSVGSTFYVYVCVFDQGHHSILN